MRAPSEKPNLNIFPKFSQVRTFSMLIWPLYHPQKYKIAFVTLFSQTNHNIIIILNFRLDYRDHTLYAG